MKKNALLGFLSLFILLGFSMTVLGQDAEPKLTDEEKEIFNSAEENKAKEKAEKDDSEFDIVIIDIGFNQWLNRIAQPKGYYSQAFMENRNYLYVLEWNRRFLEPNIFDPLLYELQINYDPTIDYGYDVNYKLYNYFIYFQRRYNQRLGPWLPRI